MAAAKHDGGVRGASGAQQAAREPWIEGRVLGAGRPVSEGGGFRVGDGARVGDDLAARQRVGVWLWGARVAPGGEGWRCRSFAIGAFVGAARGGVEVEGSTEGIDTAFSRSAPASWS